jgi:hypothetical protein
MNLIKDLNFDDKEKLQGAIVAGATMLSAFLTRKLIEKVWVKVAKSEPPTDPSDDEITWKDALIWTVATGVLVGVTNVLVSRGVTQGAHKLLN